MGKNVKGGKKNKALGRFRAPSIFRPALEPDEVYAIIDKVMGHGTMQVRCLDSIPRRCMVRKKFSGRERSSLIPGTWILVGLRSFETNDKVCDLLEIYTPGDVQRLEQLDHPWHLFKIDAGPVDGDDYIVFGDVVEDPTSGDGPLVSLDLTDDDFNDI